MVWVTNEVVACYINKCLLDTIVYNYLIGQVRSMGVKVLTEACKFTCKANQSILIYAKDVAQKKAKDSRSSILTDNSKCKVVTPLQCPYLTAACGGNVVVPCNLNETMPVTWLKTNSKIKINGHSVLTSMSEGACVSGGIISPVLPIGITTLTPVDGVNSEWHNNDPSDDKLKSNSYFKQDDNFQTKQKVHDHPDSDMDHEKKSKESYLEGYESDEVKYASHCRCDHANCKEREFCEYYKTQIFVENDSAKLSSNFKTERADEWDSYLTKHRVKLLISSEGGWRIAAHHIISGNQVLMMKDIKGNLLYGDIVKLANFFGYDVNNAFNCIMLPTNTNNFGQKEPLTKIANAYEVMWLMGRQWHVGGHEYKLSKDTLEKLMEFYIKNPDRYPFPGNTMFFNNYKTAMKEEMNKLQSGIRDQCWKKNYKHKREKFIASINNVSNNVEEKLKAFENDPRKSFPFFVSKVSVEYAYNIPSTSKIIVLSNEKNGIAAKKYRVERYIKNDLKVIFNEKGTLLSKSTDELIAFCENIMYFLIDNDVNFKLPFASSENDPYVIRNVNIGENADDYLRCHSNEVMALIQQNPRQFQPIAKTVIQRYVAAGNI